MIADGRRGYITGFSKSNVCIKDVDSNYIYQPGKSDKQFLLPVRHEEGVQQQKLGVQVRKGGAQFLPHITPLGV